MSELIKLHIGLQSPKAGWKIMDSRQGPGVDHIGDLRELSGLADASCETVYVSHLLQKVEQHELVTVLQSISRLLIPDGQLMLSVPDLEALCKLYLNPQLTKNARLQVMRMLFGGQIHEGDFNRSGLSFEWLNDCLVAAGFGFVRRVDDFGLFDDASRYAPYGNPISLNLIATKIDASVGAKIQKTFHDGIREQLNRQTLSLSGLSDRFIEPAKSLTASQPETYPASAPISAAVAAEIHQKTLQALESQNDGDTVAAGRLFREILGVQPENFAALYSLAVMASQNEEHAEALSWIRKATATAIGQNYAPAFFVEAVVLQALGRFDESLACYERAIAVDPHYESAMINRSNLYYEMKQHVKAVESFSDALKVNPASDKALAGQAIILTEMNRYEDAIPLFERMLKVNPDFDYGRGLLFHAEQHCCDWRRFDESRELIEQGIREHRRVCKTLPFMSLSNAPDDLLQCVKIFAEHLFSPKAKPLWQGQAYRHDKIRLAYVSPDFREHPVGHLMAGIIEHHDKSKFETIAISLGLDDHGSLRQRFERAFDRFIDVRGRKSWDIAEMIRSLEVDILVDLAGYTADSRTDVFAFRPAPIQVNFLGYPGTLGVDYMDYILADRVVIPEEHRRFFTEKVAYLPDAYLPTDSSLKIAERTPTREEMGLPATGVVFCSFNHDYKINPPVFDVWMRLLDQVPDSVLWLMKLNEPAQRNLRREAEQRGIDPNRLIFATRVPLVEDHLARYRLADMFLDTSPYNAHTTASDALRVGLPVVTYLGNTFSGRVAASLLHAIGLPELITQSLEEYEALALKLAREQDLLKSLKAKLLANQANFPLFKTDLFCSNLERVFGEMLEDHQKRTH